MLKNSARNCMEKRSLIGMALKAEKSNLAKPGPKVVPWPPPRIGTLVKQPGVAAAPIGQGCWKAAGFPIQFSFPFESVWNPSFGLCPGTFTSKQLVPEVVAVGQLKVTGCPP